jgi:hypothetical protein
MVVMVLLLLVVLLLLLLLLLMVVVVVVVVVVVLVLQQVVPVLVVAVHVRRLVLAAGRRRRRTIVRLRQYRVLELGGQIAGAVLGAHRFEHGPADESHACAEQTKKYISPDRRLTGYIKTKTRNNFAGRCVSGEIEH